MNDREFRQRIADLLAKQRGVTREISKKPPQSEPKFKLKVRRSKAS